MKKKEIDLPSVEQLAAELERENGKKEYGRSLRTTVFVLLLVTAAAIIVAVFLFPVVEIKGETMAPTLQNGDYLVAAQTAEYSPGDMIVFYYNNVLLVKRVIAVGGDEVNLDEDGSVLVNGRELQEPYVREKALGECSTTFPLTVPKDEYFVLGDNRAQSVDSRNTAVGTVSQDLIVGRLLFRVWPFSAIGTVH